MLLLAALVALGVTGTLARAASPLTVELSAAAISPNGDGAGDTTAVTVTTDGTQPVTVTVTNAAGALVRTIWSGALAAGPTTLAWDGTTDAGTPAADGAYTVTATEPDGTSSHAPITVDTAAPVITVTGHPHHAANDRELDLPLRLSEPTQLTVTVDPSHAGTPLTLLEPAGAVTLKLHAPARVYAAKGGAGSYTVSLAATDAAWNAGAATATVGVDPASAAAPNDPVSAAGGAIRFAWPLRGVITSPFGPRPRDFHAGVDIAGPMGEPIHAAAAGVVSFAGPASGYGKLIIIDHGNGWTTRYGHEERQLVHAGQRVRAGQTIALVGAEGDATGPHLHFEIRINGTAHDPIPFL